MKIELFKFLKSKLVFLIPLFIFTVVSIFSFTYHFTVGKDRRVSNVIAEYKDIEEIPNTIENYKLSLDELKTEKDDGKITEEEYQDDKDRIEKAITIYNYLYDNKITYKDFQETETLLNDNNRPGFMNIAGLMLQIIGIVSIGILSLNSFNYEFQVGVSKFVYMNKKRHKVIINKTLMTFILSISFMLFTILCTYIFSLSYSEPYKVLISYVNGKLTAYTASEYIFKVLLFSIVDIIPYMILFIGVSIFVKNILFALGIDFGVYLFLIVFCNKVRSPSTMSFSTPYMYTANNGITLSLFLITYFIKLIVALIVLISAFIYFRKKDLI